MPNLNTNPAQQKHDAMHTEGSYTDKKSDAFKDVHSINDPLVQELMNNAPEGKIPFYSAIGTLGGNAVVEKYKNYRPNGTAKGNKLQ